MSSPRSILVGRIDSVIPSKKALEILFKENVYWEQLWMGYCGLSPKQYLNFFRGLQRLGNHSYPKLNIRVNLDGIDLDKLGHLKICNESDLTEPVLQVLEDILDMENQSLLSSMLSNSAQNSGKPYYDLRQEGEYEYLGEWGEFLDEPELLNTFLSIRALTDERLYDEQFREFDVIISPYSTTYRRFSTKLNCRLLDESEKVEQLAENIIAEQKLLKQEFLSVKRIRAISDLLENNCTSLCNYGVCDGIFAQCKYSI